MTPNLKTSLFCLLATGASSALAGFESCAQYFHEGAAPRVSATAPGRQRELCFDSFAILHSGTSKTAVFVAQRLSRAVLKDALDEERTDKFYEEARLPSADRAKLSDYKATTADGRRFDRGHLAPAADMPNANAMAQSFSLANIVPQAPQNNRKTWAGLEKSTRKYITRADGDVYVFTGPVYSGTVEALGTGQVWIPTYLFKLVYDPVTNRAWAHWIENTDEARVSRPISYEDLVRLTGTDFLPAKPAGFGAKR